MAYQAPSPYGTPEPALVSPLASPEIRLSRPEYTAVATRSRTGSSESRREKRPSRFEEAVDPGLGIHLSPMGSPMGSPQPPSPGNLYHQLGSPNIGSPHVGSYSPLPRSGTIPPFARTPDTLYSLSGRKKDAATEQLIAHRATQATRWKVHWRTPALMVFSFLAGIALAFAQHLLYKELHHKAEFDEEKKVRVVLYGRALAYLSKLAFGGCAVLCYRQRIWRTFRTKALSVLSIDQLFGATEDPSLFVNWETLTQAPILVAMALLIWLIPLATIIFSPGALTFGSYLEHDTEDLLVPTLNFSAESYADYRYPPKVDDMMKKSVMFYNTTDTSGHKEGFFDYYDKASVDMNRIALQMAYSLMDHPSNRQDGREASCGPFNCTYEQSFVAPAYKCEQVAQGVGDPGRLAEFGAPFNTSLLSPEGNHVYYADVDVGQYARPQAPNLLRGGVPDGFTPDDLGTFKTEPVLWIGYSVNSTVPVPKDSPFALNWTHLFEPYIFRCVHYEATYKLKWNYTEPWFHVHTEREYLNPIVDTNFSRFDDGTVDYSTALPVENYVSPRTDVARYKKTASYVALGESLRDFLRGSVEMDAPLPGPSIAIVYSKITMTRLIDKMTNTPLKDLAPLVEDFYSDMVLSLFSKKDMLIVSRDWATVNRTRYQNSFIYNPTKLWTYYAPVIFFTLVALIFASWTIYEDGTTFSVGFSRILVTTRNTTLDDISRGACLGNDPFPRELMHTRLKFGVLNDDDGFEFVGSENGQMIGHCAFGVPSEVTPIVRGMPYAGLDRKRKENPRPGPEKVKVD